MTYLLVDDSDASVVAELESVEHALRLLERLHDRDPELATSFSVVRFEEAQGTLAGSSASIAARVLPELPGAPGVPDLRMW